MIQTRVYYPTDMINFRRNLQKNFDSLEDIEKIVHYNSDENMSKRTDKVLIYHVLDATVFVNTPDDDHGRINITAKLSCCLDKIESAKLLLEDRTKIKLRERS